MKVKTNAKLKVKVEVYPSTRGRSGSIYLEIIKNSKKNRKSGKTFSFDEGLPLNTLLPLSKGDGGNSAQLIAGKSLLLLSAGDIQSDLQWLNLRAPVIETDRPVDDGGDVAKKLSFKFQVEDPFKFDNAGLTVEAEAAIKEEMGRLSTVLNDAGLYERYLQEKINGKNIIVQAFSSIDAESDGIGGGDVSECSPGGTTTRAQYNLCLSQKRAETIVNHLTSNYKNIFGKSKLIAKGMGELESPNSVNLPYKHPLQIAHREAKRVATKKDRKFVINLPDFETTQIIKK